MRVTKLHSIDFSKVVTALGNGAHVIMLHELVDKTVRVRNDQYDVYKIVQKFSDSSAHVLMPTRTLGTIVRVWYDEDYQPNNVS